MQTKTVAGDLEQGLTVNLAKSTENVINSLFPLRFVSQCKQDSQGAPLQTPPPPDSMFYSRISSVYLELVIPLVFFCVFFKFIFHHPAEELQVEPKPLSKFSSLPSGVEKCLLVFTK